MLGRAKSPPGLPAHRASRLCLLLCRRALGAQACAKTCCLRNLWQATPTPHGTSPLQACSGLGGVRGVATHVPKQVVFAVFSLAGPDRFFRAGSTAPVDGGLRPKHPNPIGPVTPTSPLCRRALGLEVLRGAGTRVPRQVVFAVFSLAGPDRFFRAGSNGGVGWAWRC